MFLAKMMGIGTADLRFIEQYYAVVSDYIDYTNLEEIPLGQINANMLLDEIFYQINHEVFGKIKNQIENDHILFSHEGIRGKLLKVCEDRTDNFSPFINCIDSWFQNELDEVTIQGQSLEKIVDEVRLLLLENIAD